MHLKSILRSLLARVLSAKAARIVSVVNLVLIGVALGFIFAFDRPGGPAFGPRLGGDYAQFYAIGVLQNEVGIERLYDLRLQEAIMHRSVRNMRPDEHLFYAYPPLPAPAFRLLAQVRYQWSFAIWLVLSAAFYVAAIALALHVCEAIPRRDRETVWWLALSFKPFAVECWLGGQLSSLGCLIAAIVLANERRGRPVAAGVACAFLLYKPSLVVLIVPMLVVGRQWRTLAGFAGGAMVLTALSAVIAGPDRCWDFVRLLLTYVRLGGSGIPGFRVSQYVDITAFLRVLGFGHEIARPVAVAVAVPCLIALSALWFRAGGRTDDARDLAWAATFCWTPVLNLYSPVYDVVLIVPGLVLAANALRTRNPAGWPMAFCALVALLYVGALLSSWTVVGLGVPSLTPALTGVAAYLTWAAFKAAAARGPNARY